MKPIFKDENIMTDMAIIKKIGREKVIELANSIIEIIKDELPYNFNGAYYDDVNGVIEFNGITVEYFCEVFEDEAMITIELVEENKFTRNGIIR